MRGLLVVISTLWLVLAQAQEEYARGVIETLCSDDFHGRGYVANGDKIAAEFIIGELEAFGIKPLCKDYTQEFALDVNTFPGMMTVIINEETLVTGQDYIVQSQSGSMAGTYSLVLFEADSIADLVAQIELGIDRLLVDGRIAGLKLNNEDEQSTVLQLAAELSQYVPVMVCNTKFTWSVSSYQNDFPVIEVKPEFLVDGAKVKVAIMAEFVENYATQNILGYIKGTDKKRKNEYIVFTAHYDHLGHMGSEVFIPGANDNASGVSMLLALAKHYTENPPEHSVAFMFFGAEEAGILGSMHYVENPEFPLQDISFLLNLDLLGTGENGIQVVNSTVFTEQFDVLDSLNNENKYLVNIKKRGAAANSDHHWFYEQGVPCFFIYTLGGISAYHDIYDKAETLPLTEFNDLFNLLTEFIATF